LWFMVLFARRETQPLLAFISLPMKRYNVKALILLSTESTGGSSLWTRLPAVSGRA
jgi:hypothetical protein